MAHLTIILLNGWLSHQPPLEVVVGDFEYENLPPVYEQTLSMTSFCKLCRPANLFAEQNDRGAVFIGREAEPNGQY